jgi:hypothetical protein
MSEAIAQSTGIIPYFQGLAGFTAASHPATTNLCVIALNLGQFMVMFYKDQYQRPRPSQLRPALLPSMEVPGHASYPSGHSTESHLIANLLSVVIGNENRAYSRLRPLADRIAINREVMGLHYRSDSEAGRRLASNLSDFIRKIAEELMPYDSPPVTAGKHHPILYDTLMRARLEWHPKEKQDQALNAMKLRFKSLADERAAERATAQSTAALADQAAH